MKTIVILLTTLVASIFNSSEKNVEYYQDCNTELAVEKDRSFKSADEDGASFTLILTNTSSKEATYTLSTRNLLEPCNNSYDKSTAANVNLNVSIQTNTLKGPSENKITLKSGQEYKFVVNVTVPKGTKYNTWSCIDVEAKSENCSAITKTRLSVFVPDPTEG
jgi:hypothetical protein